MGDEPVNDHTTRAIDGEISDRLERLLTERGVTDVRAIYPPGHRLGAVWSLYLRSSADLLIAVSALNRIPGVSDATAHPHSHQMVTFAVERCALPAPT